MEKGSAKILVVFFILFLILLIACLGAYAYITTDMFKTPKQLFVKYLYNNVEQLENVTFKPFDEIAEKLNQGEISLNIKTELEEYFSEDFITEEDDEEEEQNTKNKNKKEEKEEADNKLNVSFGIAQDQENKKAKMFVNAKMGDENVANYDLVYSNNTFGLRIPEAHDKYLALENRDLKQFFKKFGIDDEEILNVIPDKYPVFEEDFYSEGDSSVNLEELKNKYLNKIFENLGNDKFIEEKNVTIQIDGGPLTVDKYSVTIYPREVITIAKSVLEEVKNDETILNIYEKIGKKDDFYKAIDSFSKAIDELEKEIDEEIEKTPVITIAVYKRSKKTVRTEFKKDEECLTFEIKNDNQNEPAIYFILDKIKGEKEKVGSTMSLIISNKYENNKGTINADLKLEYNQDDIDKLEDEEDTYYSLSDYYENQAYNIKLVTDISNEKSAKTKITTNLGDNEFITIPEIELVYKFTAPKIDKLDDENSIVLNDYTVEDFQKLLEELGENIFNNAEEYPNSILVSSITGSSLLSSNSSIDNDLTNKNKEDKEKDKQEEKKEEKKEVDHTSDKKTISSALKLSLMNCLSEYKADLADNEYADLSYYLSIEKIKSNCTNKNIKNIELINGSTLKYKYEDETYYSVIEIDADKLEVSNLETYTTKEYEELEEN